MELGNAEQANKFLTETVKQVESLRMMLTQRIGFDRCFYEGLQLWTQKQMNFVTTTMGRRYSTWDPDAKNLNIVINRTTLHVNKSASATFPEKIYVDGLPPENDTSMRSAWLAQLLETLTNDVIDWSDYLVSRRNVNYGRCITGVAGLAWVIYDGFRILEMNGQKIRVPSKELLCREFDPSRLVLDPAVNDRDLRRHEYVTYEDIWPIDKIRAVFPGVKLDADQCKTVGELTATEQKFANLSAGRLYKQYEKYSKTKGAKVYQIHMKDGSNRHNLYYTAVEPAKQEERIWTNLDNPETPFGGCGLPFALWHGIPRSDSMWSIGDVAMMRDDQSKLNMIASIAFRQLRAAAGYQMRYDPRGIPKNIQEEAYTAIFTNRVAGAIPFEPRSRDVLPPELMKYPAPDHTILDMIQDSEGAMERSVNRAPVHYGELKTHTPDASVARAIKEADSVANVRIKTDIETDASFLTVGLGTALKLAQGGSPGVLAQMTQAGYDTEDLGAFAQTDCYDPPVKLVVRESSVRVRPPEERKQDIIRLAQADIAAISGSELRLQLANMDMAGTEQDQQMHASLRRAVLRVAAGEEWNPIPLGPYAEWALSMLRMLAVDARKKGDRATEQRATQGILVQQQTDLEEKINNDPNVAIQRMQAQAQMQQQAQRAQEQQQPDEPEPQNVGELLNRLTAGAA